MHVCIFHIISLSRRLIIHFTGYNIKCICLYRKRLILCLFDIAESDQMFPGLQRFRNPVCADDIKYLADCKDPRTVIAIENIVAGAKPAYKECPLLYEKLREKDCCNVSSNDCTFR